ncbi:MAG: hypothetical protein JWM44_514, partial [Bacilli bacterium]|nr:hypothetical protein [Bacilli bacterium]
LTVRSNNFPEASQANTSFVPVSVSISKWVSSVVRKRGLFIALLVHLSLFVYIYFCALHYLDTYCIIIVSKPIIIL